MNLDDRKRRMWGDRKSADSAHTRPDPRQNKDDALSGVMQAAALGDDDFFSDWAVRARRLGASDSEIEDALKGGRHWRGKALRDLEDRWRRGEKLPRPFPDNPDD